MRISAKKKNTGKNRRCNCNFGFHLSTGCLGEALKLAVQCKPVKIPVISTLPHYCSDGFDSAEVSHLFCITYTKAEESFLEILTLESSYQWCWTQWWIKPPKGHWLLLLVHSDCRTDHSWCWRGAADLLFAVVWKGSGWGKRLLLSILSVLSTNLIDDVVVSHTCQCRFSYWAESSESICLMRIETLLLWR